MKFLLDIGLSQSTTFFLRAQGHDAVHLRDQGLHRLKDEQISEKARQEERIILTHDKVGGSHLSPSPYPE